MNTIFEAVTSLFLSKLTILLIDAIAIYLAVIVYRDNRKGKINKIYLIMTVLMLTWINFAYIPRFIITQYPLSLFLLKIAWLASPLFIISIYFLAINLIHKSEKYNLLSKVILFVSVITAILTGFTNYIIKGLEVIDGIVTINYGHGMYPFLGVAFLNVVATLYPVFRKDILKDDRVRYFLVGIFIFYFANTIFNITLPVFFGVSRFYFFGDYSTLILLGYTSYSILRHELFEIKVAAAEVLTFSIWLALATEIFTAASLKDKITEIVVFILIIIFGVLLIRSVKKEVRQREELEKLTTQLEKANEKLKKLDALKDEFISIASHQLRTPLTVIKGYLSMIMEGDFGKVNGKQTDPMRKITESSDRLIQLVENMLNVSRIESGRIQYNFKDARLEDLVRSVADELTNKAKLKLLDLRYNAPALPLSKVKIDEEKIRQVVINLIDNSIKYTDKGKVTVDLKQVGNNLEFSVSDTGSGIKKDDFGKLFQKFSRGTGATSITEGTGLGLYVARQMVEAHKGHIWAESKGEGMGSKFCFSLPI